MISIFHNILSCIEDVSDDAETENKSLEEPYIYKIRRYFMSPKELSLLSSSLKLTEKEFVVKKQNKLDVFPLSSQSEILSEKEWFFTMEFVHSLTLHTLLRLGFCRYYSWAIPTKEAIDLLVKYSPILEVGAGNGYWAWEMRRWGADAIATDLCQSDMKGSTSPLKMWVNVENIGAVEAIKKYCGKTLFMCWPHGYAWEALKAFEDNGGQVFIIVGDRCVGLEGSMADDPFGGEDKKKDQSIMKKVRERLYSNFQQNTIKTSHKNEIESYINRIEEANQNWVLASEIKLPNFILTEDGHWEICDTMRVYLRSKSNEKKWQKLKF